MKNKIRKNLVLMLSVLILFSSFLTSAHCEGEPVFEKNYTIDSSDFYGVLPEEFKPSFNGDGKYYAFTDQKRNYIYIYRTSNEFFKEGISSAEGNHANELMKQAVNYMKNEDVLPKLTMRIEKTQKEKINSLWIFNIEGKFGNKKMDYFGGDEFFDFNTKIFASEKYIYIATLTSTDKKITQDLSFSFNQFVKSIRINGPYLPKDLPLNDHEFNSAFDFNYEIENRDSKFYSYDDIQDFYNFTGEELTLFNKVVKGISIALCVPTTVVLIALIIMIIKFIKKVKIVNEYKEELGEYQCKNINPGILKNENFQGNNPENENKRAPYNDIK